MKYFPYILIAFLVLTTPVSTKIDSINPVFGGIAFTINNLDKEEVKPVVPTQKECDGSGFIKTKSGDGLLEITTKCPGCDNCKNRKQEVKAPEIVPPEPEKLDPITVPKPSIVKSEKDFPLYKTDFQSFEIPKLKPPKDTFKPQFKVLAPTSTKELWVLVGKKGECPPCDLQNKELEILDKKGWKVDDDGDMSSSKKYHIRVISTEYFNGLIPDIFFVKTAAGNELYTPTLIYWENFQIKYKQVGTLNRWGIGKLFEGKPIETGKDDVIR